MLYGIHNFLVLMDADLEKHRRAGEILVDVRERVVEEVEPGVSHLEVAELAEELIREKGAAPAFPLNISIDEEAAHATPSRDSDEVFGDDMVNIDIGVHVDGWIADSAVTVDMSGNPDLVEASREALEAAVDKIEGGVNTADIGAIIEDTIKGYGFNPVYNLTGHGLGHFEQHTSPTIPNRGVDQGVELREGMVIAIEPFATDGSGKVEEGSTTEIYSLNEIGAKVRSRGARELISKIEESYRTLPFAKRWLPKKMGMRLRRLEGGEVIHGYPVLKEEKGKLVSQKEHTVIVESDGCEVITSS